MSLRFYYPLKTETSVGLCRPWCAQRGFPGVFWGTRVEGKFLQASLSGATNGSICPYAPGTHFSPEPPRSTLSSLPSLWIPPNQKLLALSKTPPSMLAQYRVCITCLSPSPGLATLLLEASPPLPFLSPFPPVLLCLLPLWVCVLMCRYHLACFFLGFTTACDEQG